MMDRCMKIRGGVVPEHGKQKLPRNALSVRGWET